MVRGARIGHVSFHSRPTVHVKCHYTEYFPQVIFVNVEHCLMCMFVPGAPLFCSVFSVSCPQLFFFWYPSVKVFLFLFLTGVGTCLSLYDRLKWMLSPKNKISLPVFQVFPGCLRHAYVKVILHPRSGLWVANTHLWAWKSAEEGFSLEDRCCFASVWSLLSVRQQMKHSYRKLNTGGAFTF